MAWPPAAPTGDTGPVALPPLAPADHVCDAFAMSYSTITPVEAAAMVRQAPAQYRAAFAGVADDAVRRRPDAATWSMIEYACHTRDVFAVSVDRIQLARAEEHATFAPLGNDERAVRLHYGEADVDATLEDLAASAARLADLLDSLDDGAWARTASRLPGEERDVLWLARQAAHEGRHHLADITVVHGAVT